MRLTGKQIIELGIVTNPGKDCEQQVGVDLELIKIEKVVSDGFIPKEGKTILAERRPVKAVEVDGKQVWQLQPGVYDITVAQGCKIPANKCLRIVQRSSGLRNGVILSSSMFDPGFETSNIGTIMHVQIPITIEVGARIGQAYVDDCYEVEEGNLYNGQFQRDQQRDLKQK